MPYILNSEEKILKAFEKFSKYKRANHRYASFDYCYGYFSNHINNFASKKNIEISCLQLVSYLASWGMYRGSSFLLREKSIKYFEKLITWISNCPRNYWEIDVDNYTDENISILLKIYLSISQQLELSKNRAPVLATKIMLGIFGNTPAFDDNFRKTFSRYFSSNPGFSRYNKESLDAIKNFYNINHKLIDKLSKKNKVLDFSNGRTKISYPKVKIIDMIGFGYKLP